MERRKGEQVFVAQCLNTSGGIREHRVSGMKKYGTGAPRCSGKLSGKNGNKVWVPIAPF